MIDSWLVTIFRIVLVAIGIGLVIFVHELGHFLVAKRVGIRVDVFSLGFGPRLFGFKRRGTDYRISAVPLGGYVKMAGESPDEATAGASDEFSSKSVGARALVIVAGVLMNVVFAVAGFLFAFKIGVRMDEPAVGRVQQGTAAEAAGLRYGDVVVRIGGERPLEFMDLGLAAAYASGPLDVTVERDGVLHDMTVTPRRSVGSPVQQLGFERMEAVHDVVPGSAAEAAGFRKGDWIVGLDGKPLSSYYEFATAVYDSPGRTLEVEVRRDGKYKTLTLTPTKRPARTYGIALSPLPVIWRVIPDTPAAEAGLEAGDTITAIGGAPADYRTFKERVSATAPGKPLELTISRGGETRSIAVAPMRDGGEDDSGRPVIGIRFGEAVVGEVEPGSPAAEAGIEPGDRITEVDGKSAVFGDLGELDRVASLPDASKSPLVLTIVKKDTTERQTVRLAPAAVEGRFVGEAGIEMATATFEEKVPGLIEPIRLGFNRTFMFIEQVFLTFQGMFTQRIDPSTLGGPIGIAETAYRVSEYGLGKLIYFLAIISVNLAVLNILPIPILDGGHLAFLAIEKVRGAPVAPAVQAAAQWVGLALLLGLMIFVTKNDIVRTFLGG